MGLTSDFKEIRCSVFVFQWPLYRLGNSLLKSEECLTSFIVSSGLMMRPNLTQASVLSKELG